MRYGFCTGIATKARSDAGYFPALIRRIQEAGFDFVEFPLTAIANMDDETFETLCASVRVLGLGCDCMANFFPGSLRVLGPDVDRAAISAYVNTAMQRASRMGTSKIVFGSWQSRNLPESMPAEAGYSQLSEIIRECMLPACQEYDMVIVVEPISPPSSNFICRLSEGQRVVNLVGDSHVKLLADLMHMQYSHDSPAELYRLSRDLLHVHICELDRVLPEARYSDYVRAALAELVRCGYDGTISFESKDAESADGLQKALSLLKNTLAALAASGTAQQCGSTALSHT